MVQNFIVLSLSNIKQSASKALKKLNASLLDYLFS